MMNGNEEAMVKYNRNYLRECVQPRKRYLLSHKEDRTINWLTDFHNII